MLNRRQGHGSSFIDTCGEQRPVHVVWSNRQATVAQIAEEVNAGSDRKVSEYTVHRSLLHMGLHSRRPVRVPRSQSSRASVGQTSPIHGGPTSQLTGLKGSAAKILVQDKHKTTHLCTYQQQFWSFLRIEAGFLFKPDDCRLVRHSLNFIDSQMLAVPFSSSPGYARNSGIFLPCSALTSCAQCARHCFCPNTNRPQNVFSSFKAALEYSSQESWGD